MAASRNKLSPDLLGRVGDFIATRQASSDRLCVGLSGGCDSVVLLHLASRLGFGERLTALHVHHGLSPNADTWADFCKEYCASLGVPLLIQRVRVATDTGLGLEAAARNARYAAFVESAADTLLLAHHRGDQAETVLFNLLRGSGVAGAAGMPDERRLGGRRLLRPLLDTGRRELEDYAGQHGLRWIDDESNIDLRYARNYLRHQAMPMLGERFPAAETALALAARHFGEADGLLAELAAGDWQAVEFQDGCASLAALRSLSLPRLKNLLRYRLRVLGWRAPGAERLDEFARQLLTAGPDRHPELVLADGTLRAAKGHLHWLPQK